MSKIVWLTGPSGCGKTTIANKVLNFVDGVRIDGDEMRKSISVDEGFSPEDRERHNLRVARLAKELSKQTNVIVCLIAPSKEIREKVSEICNPIWVYLKRDVPERENHYYEEPEGVLKIDNNTLSIEDSARMVRRIFEKEKKKYSMFIGRWQCIPPHAGHLGLFDVKRKEGKNILIAIRDTEIDEKNPYTVQERIKSLKENVPDAEVIVIPDIEEVCYGRGVGYGITLVELSENLHKISGTKMREKGKG